MMLRVVLRATLPLAVATVFCLPVVAQADGSASSSSPASSTSLYGTPVEQIIARVNDRVISNSDLERAQQQLAQQDSQQNLSPEEIEEQQKNLLRDLIDRQLLLSKGKELGITGDTELIKALDEIRKQNHLDSMEDLEKAVQQQGTSYEDFKANIRDNIIAQNVVRDEVGSKLHASHAQMEQYYEAHKDNFAQQESVRLSEILIPTAADASDAQLAAAAAQAKSIEAKLKSGADFAQLAKQDSSGSTAQQGGDLGEFHRGTLAKMLEDQTFNLPVGGYTQPIRTRQGYVILKVTQHVPGGIPPLQQVEPQVEQAVYMEQMEPALRKYLTRLREEAYIDIRPGYVDTGASPNETKPIYSAYTPPLSKKEKQKQQMEKRRLKLAAMAARDKWHRGRKTVAGAPIAGAAATSSAAGAKAAASSSSTSSVALLPAAAQAGGKLVKKKKVKREKIRYGRAPLYRLSEEQVPNETAPASSAASAKAAPAESESEDATMGSEAQPLGPDLTHTPGAPVKKGKVRLSDLPKQKRAAKKRAPKKIKPKKTKPKTTQPPVANTDELATQKVQSAPLGLAGDTASKKKKSSSASAVVHPGVKTRMSDEKKKKPHKKKKSAAQPESAPSTGASTSSSSSSSADSGASQP
jgi:peptidyl-prolyl cis-trans isomerase SurA